MLNTSPIVLNCFSRGGSNILWNYFLSHPDVCHPIEETLQIFSTSIKVPRSEGFKVAWMEKRFLFNQWNFNNRMPVSSKTAKYIDDVLYKRKLGNLFDQDMKYKLENKLYTKNEVEKSRLVLKNNNGLTFCSNLFLKIFPDTTFIGLVRHPIALYESHKRRKTPVAESLNTFTNYYKKMVEKMLNDKESIPNYHIIKFEELLTSPIESIKKLYGWAQLEFSMIRKIRLKAKPSMNEDGVHLTPLKENKHYWFSFVELGEYLDTDVNKHQVSRLEQIEKESLIKSLREVMPKIGYHDF
ncbi:MAG: hypothetical protein HOE96_02895 [Candidatus Marinimicrobia bacterium]|nr:hypothetical protein [Candidatus Neomarinimicrobiota bacterium]